LIAISIDHLQVNSLFRKVTTLSNVVGVSYKWADMLCERQKIRVKESLENGEIVGGRGLNQETNMKLYADTYWSSHFATLVTLMNSYVTDVLEMLKDHVLVKKKRPSK